MQWSLGSLRASDPSALLRPLDFVSCFNFCDVNPYGMVRYAEPNENKTTHSLFISETQNHSCDWPKQTRKSKRPVPPPLRAGAHVFGHKTLGVSVGYFLTVRGKRQETLVRPGGVGEGGRGEGRRCPLSSYATIPPTSLSYLTF